MRDDRHAAGLADQAHRLHRVKGLLGHVVGAARVEQAVEGLGAVPHDSGGDQRVGDVRSAHCGVALPHLREHVVPGQRVVGGQALEDGAGATLAAEANLLHAVCKLGVHRVEAVGQQVNCLRTGAALGVVVAAGELGAGQKVQAVFLGQAGGPIPPGCGVVVGQGEPGQPGLGDERHQLFKALGAV